MNNKTIKELINNGATIQIDFNRGSFGTTREEALNKILPFITRRNVQDTIDKDTNHFIAKNGNVTVISWFI